jgi:signal transduction histidine kinase
MSKTDSSRRLGKKIQAEFDRAASLAASITAGKKHQAQAIDRLQSNLEAMHGILNDKIQSKWTAKGPLQPGKMEAIGTLAEGIAHDFNNILTSTLGYTELALQDVPKKNPLASHLQEVYAAGDRAKQLVKQILTFARKADESAQPVQLSIIVTAGPAPG